jgi:hypothetical protein
MADSLISSLDRLQRLQVQAFQAEHQLLATAVQNHGADGHVGKTQAAGAQHELLRAPEINPSSSGSERRPPSDPVRDYEAASAAERTAFEKMMEVDPNSPDYAEHVERWRAAMADSDIARKALLLNVSRAPQTAYAVDRR